MRRRRFQKPKIKNVGGYWIAQFRDLEGTKKRTSLGPVSKVKKYEAEEKLAQILEPLNTRLAEPTPNCTFGQFIRQIYLPFYKRKWKTSTAVSNEDRLGFHLTGPFEDRPLSNFNSDELQGMLDQKAAGGLSYSVVAHLRWDLRQVFRMAVSEGYLLRNPAELAVYSKGSETTPSHKHDLRSGTAVLFRARCSTRRLSAAWQSLPVCVRGKFFALRRSVLEANHPADHSADIPGQARYAEDVQLEPVSRRSGMGFRHGWHSGLKCCQIPGRMLGFSRRRTDTPVLKDNCWRRRFDATVEGGGA